MNISKIAEQLNEKSKNLPIAKQELEGALEKLFHEILFPICNNECRSEKNLHLVYSILLENISNLLSESDAERILESFFLKLPDLQSKLLLEAENFLKNDPAARSIEEVILTYPGFFAISVYHISHTLYELGTPIIPRLFSEYAHAKVGIDIHPAAQIGSDIFIDHGTGIVIGETSIIGNNVKIYQGVTLGALFVTRSLKDTKRHPTIEDNVVIYAGATILGGNTIVGHDSTIGGNVWLTKTIIPYSIVFNNSEVRIRTTQDFEEVLNFVI